MDGGRSVLGSSFLPIAPHRGIVKAFDARHHWARLVAGGLVIVLTTVRGHWSGGSCTMRGLFFFFFCSFLFITDRSLRQHAMAMNGTRAPCFAVPFARLQTLSPFCPQWDGIAQVSQSERLIHGCGMPQAVRSAAGNHTEWCFHSSTTDKMEGGERKSGPCPGSPLTWVLTIHSSQRSQRTERRPDLLPFVHIVPFGNSTSQRTHESDHARSSTLATMGRQKRKKNAV